MGVYYRFVTPNLKYVMFYSSSGKVGVRVNDSHNQLKNELWQGIAAAHRDSTFRFRLQGRDLYLALQEDPMQSNHILPQPSPYQYPVSMQNGISADEFHGDIPSTFHQPAEESFRMSSQPSTRKGIGGLSHTPRKIKTTGLRRRTTLSTSAPKVGTFANGKQRHPQGNLWKVHPTGC